MEKNCPGPTCHGSDSASASHTMTFLAPAIHTNMAQERRHRLRDKVGIQQIDNWNWNETSCKSKTACLHIHPPVLPCTFIHFFFLESKFNIFQRRKYAHNFPKAPHLADQAEKASFRFFVKEGLMQSHLIGDRLD